MKRIIILITFISICIIGTMVAILSKDDNKDDGYISEERISEAILDECTEEYENMGEDIIKTNSEQEKISPNCKIVLTKYYKKCQDEINDYIEVPELLVNCTKEELQKQYKNWDIKEFSSDQIILYKEFDGECGEHYKLKDENGKISIYKIGNSGKEELYEKTQISTEYLPEGDKKAIKEGLKVNSREKLNELIESFE